MPSCAECAKGEYRGSPSESAPEWEVGTMWFWCPERRHHDQFAPACNLYEQGEPRMYDKRGNPVRRHEPGEAERKRV